MPRLLRFGTKEVYLPNFTVALLHSDRLPPSQAKFQVPLHFSKFDLRDYLYHAYNIKATNIRSYIIQQKVRSEDRNVGFEGTIPRQWYRPRAIKRMTVEMDQPFVWPEVPEDFTPWGQKTFNAAHQTQEEAMLAQDPNSKFWRRKIEDERKALREQAKELLEGKKKWQPTWMELQKQGILPPGYGAPPRK